MHVNKTIFYEEIISELLFKEVHSLIVEAELERLWASGVEELRGT